MVGTITNQRLSAPLHVEIKFGGSDSVFTDRSKPSSYASRNFQIGFRLNAPRPRRNSRQFFSITESKSTNPKARRVGPCCLRVRSEVRLLLYHVPRHVHKLFLSASIDLHGFSKKQSIEPLWIVCSSKFNLLYTAIRAREHSSKPQGSKFQRLMHTRDVREYDYISRRLLQLLEYNYINARLRQRRAPPRDIISWLHRLYFNYRALLQHRLATAPAHRRLLHRLISASFD
jgi:hypothetical protein